MKKCSLDFVSVTKAIAVRKALEANGVKTSITKKRGKDGCIWSLLYDCEDDYSVKRIIGML